MAFEILPARLSKDFSAVARLFRAYATSLEIDLGFQDFEAEVAALPGRYAPPMGELLLARNADGAAVGCVALRPFGEFGEVKRLYVAPEGRGMGLGRALVRAIVGEADRIGYRELRLDTLATMEAAISLYRSEGFGEVGAYYETPIGNTVFMGRVLGRR